MTEAGAQDLVAAVDMVTSGAAMSVVLSNFADAARLLDAELGVPDGVVVEPRVRAGGGAFDIVVRRAVTARV